MADRTKIEWTNRVLEDGTVVPGKTFNPWIGCEKVSPACTNCYAERDATQKNFVKWGGEAAGGQRRVTVESTWRKPLAWADKAHKDGVRPLVFAASWADIFEDWGGPMLDTNFNRLYRREDGQSDTWLGLPGHLKDGRVVLGGVDYVAVTMADYRVRFFKLVAATAHGIDWILLTKRPEMANKVWTQCAAAYRHALSFHRDQPAFAEAIGLFKGDTMPNVWLGFTAENQEWFDKRVGYVHNTPAAVRLVSAEPMVGGIVMSGEANGKVYNHLAKPAEPKGLHWIITGGESGDKARAAPTGWYTSLRDQCAAAGTPFFFKQHGEWAPCDMGLETEMEEREVIPGVKLPVRKSLPIVNIDPVTGKNVVINPDGTFTGGSPNGQWQGRYGKKFTGRLLEGRTHNEIPPSLFALKPRSEPAGSLVSSNS